MKLSIVTTMYKSAPYLQEFYERVSATAKKITDDDYEIIFVDDGSPDNSLKIAIPLHEKDKKVRVLELSRNFGHHKAIMTGLAHTRGEFVFLLDCDLEEDPEWLETFWIELHRTNADVVYGFQPQRKGRFFEQLSGKIFYSLFNLVSDVAISPNLITARLMRQSYVSALVRHQDAEVFLAGLWAITGFKQVNLSLNKKSTAASTYTFWRKIQLAFNGVIAFSRTPLILLFYLGILILFFVVLYIFYLLYIFFVHGASIPGYTSIVVSIWFLGGLIISCLGIIGIYLATIFSEVKKRPYTIIRSIYEHKL